MILKVFTEIPMGSCFLYRFQSFLSHYQFSVFDLFSMRSISFLVSSSCTAAHSLLSISIQYNRIFPMRKAGISSQYGLKYLLLIFYRYPDLLSIFVNSVGKRKFGTLVIWISGCDKFKGYFLCIPIIFCKNRCCHIRRIHQGIQSPSDHL